MFLGTFVKVIYNVWMIVHSTYMIVNYSIIEPLTSRCAKFRFKPLPIKNVEERIQQVCSEEGVQIEPEVELDCFITNLSHL